MADSKQDIYCPACNEKMTKIYDAENKIYIDICSNGCGGIFFDNREFNKYDEKDENIELIKNQLKDKEFKKVDTSAQRICPICGSIMVQHPTSADGKVVIDECYTCQSIFLDYNELELIRKEYDTEEDRIKAFERIFSDEHQTEVAKIEARHSKIKPDKSYIRKAIRIFVHYMS